VLNDIQAEYDEDMSKLPFVMMDDNQNEAYPYLSYIYSRGSTSINDEIYNELFGRKNSTYEAIFELQYDGVNTINSAIRSYLGKYTSGVKPGVMKGAGTMCTDSYNPAKGFGKTDIRLLETFAYDGKAGSQQFYHKNVVGSVLVNDILDMKEGGNFSSYRNEGSESGNWPVYRVADVMMIQAEAIARTVGSTARATKADAQKKISGAKITRDILSLTEGEKLAEAFRMVNAFFIRSNPALEKTNASVADELKCDRLDETYPVDKSPAQLLQLIYQERQREFIGEGKRWFDIVRQAEAINDNEEVFASYIALPKTTTNRLKNLWSLYVPIYSEEMNINGVDAGGKLVQNPVWDRYTVK
jgi:hypothetical protein